MSIDRSTIRSRRQKIKPRNNGIHVKGTQYRHTTGWEWRVLDCRKGGKGWLLRSFTRQYLAIRYARTVAESYQCELSIHNKEGRIRQKNSYGRDPRKTKG